MTCFSDADDLLFEGPDDDKGPQPVYTAKEFKPDIFSTPSSGMMSLEENYDAPTRAQDGNLTIQAMGHTVCLRVDGRYKCDFCGLFFAFKTTLDTHVRKHTGEKPYKCEFCEKSYSEKGHLNVHKRTHTGEKPFKCDVCFKAFGYKSAWKTHMTLHDANQPPRMRNFLCPQCGKGFYQKPHLNEHLRTHSNVKEFMCELCGKEFRYKYAVKMHKDRQHTAHNQQNKAWQHNTSHGQVMTQESAQMHVKSKSAKHRPYTCDLCNKHFTQKYHLKAHHMIHSGEKPYKCTLCDQAFRHKSTLQNHKMKHVPENAELNCSYF